MIRKTIVKHWKTKSGLDAVILLMRDSYHCGYVEAPEKLVNQDYDQEVIHDIDVHGGVTYSGTLSELDNKWVFGYDCAHYGDKSFSSDFVWEEGEVRDAKFCMEQCELLAEQLVEINNMQLKPLTSPQKVVASLHYTRTRISFGE